MLTGPKTSRSSARSGRIPAGVAGSLAVLLLVVVAFSPVLSNGFVNYDDPFYVTQNVHVRSGLTWEGVRWAFGPTVLGGYRGYWTPLTWLSLMLNVQVFGVRAAPIHAVNLLLHAGSAILFFLALVRMTGRVRLSSAIALVYAVHPLHVETVAWAAERKTALAGCLAFGALLAYAWYAERPSARRYAAVAAPLVMSLLAKQAVAAALPALFLVLDVWPLGRTRWASPGREGSTRPATPTPLWMLVLEKVPLLALVVLVARVVVATLPLATDVPMTFRAAAAVTSYWAYLAKAVWPAKLAVFYPEAPSIPMWEWGVAAIGLAAVTAVLLKRGVPRAALVGWLWFLGTMVPFLGLVRVPVALGAWPSIADRFMYFPLAGVLVAAGWTIAPLLEVPWRRTAATAFLACVIAAGVARSHAYAREWHDSVTLFGAAVAATERATFARLELGLALKQEGRNDEAREVFQDLVRLAPDLLPAHMGLALARYDGAIWTVQRPSTGARSR